MQRSPVSRLIANLAYGFVALILILIPWFLVDRLIDQIPFGEDVEKILRGMGAFGSLVAFVLTLVVVVLLGHVVRMPAVSRSLSRVPILGSLLTTTNRIVDTFADSGSTRRDLVVWVAWPNAQVRTVGILVGEPREIDGCVWHSVYMMPTSGEIRRGLLRIVADDHLVRTTWTVDEAIAFVSSGGAVWPDAASAS